MFYFYFFLSFALFWDKDSLCNPIWPETHFVNQASLKHVATSHVYRYIPTERYKVIIYRHPKYFNFFQPTLNILVRRRIILEIFQFSRVPVGFPNMEDSEAPCVRYTKAGRIHGSSSPCPLRLKTLRQPTISILHSDFSWGVLQHEKFCLFTCLFW